MTLRQHLKSLRRRIVANVRRQRKLDDAQKFRRTRTLFWRARYHAATDPDRKALFLLRARRSARKGEKIEHSEHVLREREGRLRRAARKVRRRLRPRFDRSWAGSEGAAEELVRKAGLPRPPISSLKRAASHILSILNPGSDHNAANKTAYAIDFATFDGEGYARKLARAAGWTNYQTGTFDTFTYRASDGNLYRIQILWAVKGHFNHVHLGVKRI